MPRGKKEFVMNEDVMRREGYSEDTIKTVREDTVRLMQELKKKK